LEVKDKHPTSSWNGLLNRVITRKISEKSKEVLLAINDNTIVGYANDNTIVGYASVSSFKSDTKKVYVEFIAVDPAEQRKNVGKSLMNRLFEKAIKNGNETVFFVFRAEEKLVSFYKSFPYKFELKTNGGGYDENGQYEIEYFLPTKSL
jgi:ribosomal protein S18 acetylase RimI-like enzyme